MPYSHVQRKALELGTISSTMTWYCIARILCYSDRIRSYLFVRYLMLHVHPTVQFFPYEKKVSRVVSILPLTSTPLKRGSNSKAKLGDLAKVTLNLRNGDVLDPTWLVKRMDADPGGQCVFDTGQYRALKEYVLEKGAMKDNKVRRLFLLLLIVRHVWRLTAMNIILCFQSDLQEFINCSNKNRQIAQLESGISYGRKREADVAPTSLAPETPPPRRQQLASSNSTDSRKKAKLTASARGKRDTRSKPKDEGLGRI